MLCCKADKTVDVASCCYKSLHRADGVALALKTIALSPDGTELFHRSMRSTTTMIATLVAPEDEDLVLLQVSNPFRRNSAASVIEYEIKLALFGTMLPNR